MPLPYFGNPKPWVGTPGTQPQRWRPCWVPAELPDNFTPGRELPLLSSILFKISRDACFSRGFGNYVCKSPRCCETAPLPQHTIKHTFTKMRKTTCVRFPVALPTTWGKCRVSRYACFPTGKGRARRSRAASPGSPLSLWAAVFLSAKLRSCARMCTCVYTCAHA